MIRQGSSRAGRAFGRSKRERQLLAACATLEGRVFVSGVAGHSPGLLATIPGIDYDSNATVAGMAAIPASPSAAAGPGHVLTTVNSSIEWFTKAGSLQHSQSLVSFFSPLSPSDSIFDARTIYDPYAGRFMIVAADQTTSTSRLLLAVSDTSDPNGAWQFTEIDATVNVDGIDCSTQSPMIATDAQAVYISGDLYSFAFDSSEGSRLWIIDKNSLLTAATPDVWVYDAATESGLGPAAALAPAQMFGTVPGALGTFLVGAGWSDTNGIDYLSVIRVDNPLTTPTFPS
jgi:hypothetical protein